MHDFSVNDERTVNQFVTKKCGILLSTKMDATNLILKRRMNRSNEKPCWNDRTVNQFQPLSIIADDEDADDEDEKEWKCYYSLRIISRIFAAK